jgi:hypothetical protein
METEMDLLAGGVAARSGFCALLYYEGKQRREREDTRKAKIEENLRDTRLHAAAT